MYSKALQHHKLLATLYIIYAIYMYLDEASINKYLYM